MWLQGQLLQSYFLLAQIKMLEGHLIKCDNITSSAVSLLSGSRYYDLEKTSPVPDLINSP